MIRRLALVPVLLLIGLGSASTAFGQVFFSMNYSSSAYPNAGWTAWPTNASWSRTLLTGAGPSGQNVAELRQLPNPGGGDFGGQFNWGWSGNIEASDPPAGAKRYYRWRMYFTPESNFQGLAWGDGNAGDITNKLLLVGQGCSAEPCRVILTYRTDRANQRVGYFRLQIDGGAQLVDTGAYPKGQWLNVQVELTAGSAGGYKIWINNNNYASPTAQKTGIQLNSQNWKYVWFGGFNNDGLQSGGIHTYRQTDFQAATTFDSNWNGGGTSTPPPTTTPCSFTASPTSASVPAAGGTGQIAVSASPSGCSPATWTATSSSAFVTITSGASGSGSGTVAYRVAANTGAARTATITAGGRSVTISQAAATTTPTACTFAVSPTSVSVPASGGTGQVSVSVSPSGCSPASWTSGSPSSFILITSGGSGSGNGVVTYSVSSNSGASRTGTLTVAGRTVSVSQAAGSSTTPSNTKLPFTSTFDSGDFNEWDGFRNTTGATITTQGCQAGSCLRSPLIAGTTSDNYGDYYFGDFPTVGGTKVEEVWLRLYSKFDSGLTWPNRGQKIAILNLTDGVSTQRRYQVTLYVTPTGQYALEQTDIDNWVFTGIAPNVGTPAAVRLGQWDKIKVHVKLNTPGSANGIVQMWVNDVLKIDQRSLNIRKTTSYGIGKLNLSTYSTQSNPTNGVQWHDSLILSATDPDTGNGPAAPTNVRVIR